MIAIPPLKDPLFGVFAVSQWDFESCIPCLLWECEGVGALSGVAGTVLE